MVTAQYLTEKFVEPLREQLREEGRVEGREEGREEAHSKWADWYRRKTEADEKGVPFDEPPPAPLNGRDDNSHRSISD